MVTVCTVPCGTVSSKAIPYRMKGDELEQENHISSGMMKELMRICSRGHFC